MTVNILAAAGNPCPGISRGHLQVLLCLCTLAVGLQNETYRLDVFALFLWFMINFLCRHLGQFGAS